MLAQDVTPIALADETKALKKKYYLFSPRVSITVPHPIANTSFKRSFVGIYEVSGGLNVMLYQGLFIGATYKNAELKISQKNISNYDALMAINNVAVKVGGDWYVGDKNRIIYSMAVSGGKNWTKFPHLMRKLPNERPATTSYSTTYIEPEANLFFLVESNFGIGATISYTIFNRIFDPYELSLNEWAAYDKNSPGVTQYLSFGFGFYYSFLKKKK